MIAPGMSEGGDHGRYFAHYGRLTSTVQAGIQVASVDTRDERRVDDRTSTLHDR